jgi:hypothetical protein
MAMLLLEQIKTALLDTPSLGTVTVAAADLDLMLHFTAAKFKVHRLQAAPLHLGRISIPGEP